jgi:hypothetical protein
MYLDSSVAGGKVRLKHSTEAGDAVDGGLVAGELALNSADGALYYRGATGIGTFPSSSGFTQIVALSQTEYDGLIAATATSSTVLYIVTPDPAP